MQPLRCIVFTALMAAVAVPAGATDGILIEQRVTSGGTTTTNQVQITADRMRAETTESGRRQVIIFDGPAEVLYIIDEARKTYTHLTRAEVEKLGAQMGAAMEQMRAQLEKLPPAQRAQMEAMLAGRGMAVPAVAPTEYRPAGTATIGRWTCTRYEGYQNGQKTSEVCAVEPDALGFTESDFAVTRRMAEFFRAIVPQGADRLFAIGEPGDQGFSGVPVRQTTSAGGQETVMEIVDVRRETFPDTLFEPPPGLRRESFSPGR